MPVRFCRICKAPTAEGSTLCAAHRAQAASFARAVGEESEPSGAPARPPVPDSPELTILRTELAATVDAVVAAARARGRGDYRYPEVAVYFVGDRLRVRAYYGIIPPGAASPTFSVADPGLERDLRPGGTLFDEVAVRFHERIEALRAGEVELLALELLPHAGAAILSEQRGGKRSELTRFRHRDGELMRE